MVYLASMYRSLFSTFVSTLSHRVAQEACQTRISEMWSHTHRRPVVAILVTQLSHQQPIETPMVWLLLSSAVFNYTSAGVKWPSLTTTRRTLRRSATVL